MDAHAHTFYTTLTRSSLLLRHPHPETPTSIPLPPLHPLALQSRLPRPQAAVLSSAGFAFLAFSTLGPRQSITQLSRVFNNSGNLNGYLAAAALSMNIGPFTRLAMIPTNFELIEINENKGGKRSKRSAGEGVDEKDGKRRVIDSVNGEGEGSEFTDLSGPQEKTEKETTREDEAMVRKLLDRFGALNVLRALLIRAGGMVGLVTALM
ncbi:hypothetical protein BDZ45DRAFT_751978 [Acephala macrosclerotiorum]|nr:hypothetical protein BDZ45DRAFT_751978 [Acephala macrosclerotiorum]